MDITTIASAALPASATASAPAVRAPLAADDPAALRFSQVMGASVPLAPDDPVAGAASAGAAPPGSPPGESVAPRPLNMGESILNTLQGVSEDLRQSQVRIQAGLDPEGGLSIHQALSLQLEVAMMSLNFEMVGKVISKATQDVNELTKLQ